MCLFPYLVKELFIGFFLDDSSVKLYSRYIAKTLAETDIHEANRAMLSQNIKAVWEDLPPGSSVSIFKLLSNYCEIK